MTRFDFVGHDFNSSTLLISWLDHYAIDLAFTIDSSPLSLQFPCSGLLFLKRSSCFAMPGAQTIDSIFHKWVHGFCFFR